MRALVACLRQGRGFLVGLLGLTLWWPLLRRPTGFYVLAGHDFSPAVSRGWYALFLACVICLGLVVLAASPRMRHRVQGGRCRYSVGAGRRCFLCIGFCLAHMRLGSLGAVSLSLEMRAFVLPLFFAELFSPRGKFACGWC